MAKTKTRAKAIEPGDYANYPECPVAKVKSDDCLYKFYTTSHGHETPKCQRKGIHIGKKHCPDEGNIVSRVARKLGSPAVIKV